MIRCVYKESPWRRDQSLILILSIDQRSEVAVKRRVSCSDVCDASEFPLAGREGVCACVYSSVAVSSQADV